MIGQLLISLFIAVIACNLQCVYSEKYDYEKVLSGETKLPLCVGFIAYQGYKTLTTTLRNYRELGFLDMVQESRIFFQAKDSPLRHHWMKHFNSSFGDLFSDPPIISNENVMFNVFPDLSKACRSPYVLVLEEDFVIKMNRTEAARHLTHAINVLDSKIADCIRMRNIDNMGEPNHAQQSWNAGRLEKEHYLEIVVWNRNADKEFSKYISLCHPEPKTWCAPEKYAHYTNNPVIYKTEFINKFYGNVDRQGFKSRDIEITLHNYWVKLNLTVAWSHGLFTHERLDREMHVPSTRHS